MQSPHCRICGTELTPLQRRAGGVCGEWRCREALLQREAAEERSRAALRVLRRGPDTGDSGREVELESAPTVVVPFRASEIRSLPQSRRREFLAHLGVLLSRLREDDAADPVLASPDLPTGSSAAPPAPLPAEQKGKPDPLLARVCGACRGACCHAGGTHAFLEVERVRAILDRLGGPGEVVSVYEAHLPDRTVRGSCVFHTEKGCNLPRELRGDLCNRYECRGLEAARGFRMEGARTVHVVRREDQKIHDSAFAQEDRIERVRVATRAGRGPR